MAREAAAVDAALRDTQRSIAALRSGRAAFEALRRRAQLAPPYAPPYAPPCAQLPWPNSASRDARPGRMLAAARGVDAREAARECAAPCEAPRACQAAEHVRPAAESILRQVEAIRGKVDAIAEAGQPANTSAQPPPQPLPQTPPQPLPQTPPQPPLEPPRAVEGERQSAASPCQQTKELEALQETLLSKLRALENKEKQTMQQMQATALKVQEAQQQVEVTARKNALLESELGQVRSEVSGERGAQQERLRQVQCQLEGARAEVREAKEREAQMQAQLERTQGQILTLESNLLRVVHGSDAAATTATSLAAPGESASPALAGLLATRRRAEAAEEQLREREAEVQDLCQQLEETLREREALAARERETAAGEAARSELEQKLAATGEELDQTRKQLGELRRPRSDEAGAEEAELHELAKEVAQSTHALRQCRDRNKRLASEFERCREELQRHKATRDGTLVETGQLAVDRRTRAEKLERATLHDTEVAGTITLYRRAASKAVQNLTKEVSDVDRRATDAGERAAALRAKASRCAKSNARLRREVQGLAAEAEARGKLVARQKRSARALEKELSGLQERAASARAELAAAQQREEAAEQDRAAQANALEEARQREVAAQQRLAELEGSANAKRAERANLAQIKESYSSELSALRAAAQQTREKTEAASSALARAKAQLELLSGKVAARQQAFEQLEQRAGAVDLAHKQMLKLSEQATAEQARLAQLRHAEAGLERGLAAASARLEASRADIARLEAAAATRVPPATAARLGARGLATANGPDPEVEGVWRFTSERMENDQLLRSFQPQVVTIMGGVHGNERVGINVVKRLAAAMENKSLKLGPYGCELVLCLGNPRAIEEGTRWSKGGVDLNRCFRFDKLWSEPGKSEPYELQRARELRPFLDRSTVMVDFHATNKPSDPFVRIGGDVQPKHLQVASFFCRLSEPDEEYWRLSREKDGDGPPYLPLKLLLDPYHVLGGRVSTTDEYVNAMGGTAICLETGQADDTEMEDAVYQRLLKLLDLEVGLMTSDDMPVDLGRWNAPREDESDEIFRECRIPYGHAKINVFVDRDSAALWLKRKFPHAPTARIYEPMPPRFLEKTVDLGIPNSKELMEEYADDPLSVPGVFRLPPKYDYLFEVFSMQSACVMGPNGFSWASGMGTENWQTVRRGERIGWGHNVNPAEGVAAAEGGDSVDVTAPGDVVEGSGDTRTRKSARGEIQDLHVAMDDSVILFPKVPELMETFKPVYYLAKRIPFNKEVTAKVLKKMYVPFSESQRCFVSAGMESYSKRITAYHAEDLIPYLRGLTSSRLREAPKDEIFPELDVREQQNSLPATNTFRVHQSLKAVNLYRERKRKREKVLAKALADGKSVEETELKPVKPSTDAKRMLHIEKGYTKPVEAVIYPTVFQPPQSYFHLGRAPFTSPRVVLPFEVRQALIDDELYLGIYARNPARREAMMAMFETHPEVEDGNLEFVEDEEHCLVLGRVAPFANTTVHAEPIPSQGKRAEAAAFVSGALKDEVGSTYVRFLYVLSALYQARQAVGSATRRNPRPLEVFHPTFTKVGACLTTYGVRERLDLPTGMPWVNEKQDL